jgi:hypothetical protein
MLCEFQGSHDIVNRKYLLESSAMWKGELNSTRGVGPLHE